MRDAIALLTFVEDRDALDIWLTSDVPIRFGLRGWSTMFHSAPTAPELAALTAEEGEERCDAKRATPILILRSSMAPSSSGTPRAESADSDHLSRTSSKFFELAASDILKSSAPVAGSTLEAGILLGWGGAGAGPAGQDDRVLSPPPDAAACLCRDGLNILAFAASILALEEPWWLFLNAFCFS